MIPLAALIGLMFVVSQKTFAWGSFNALRKVPRSDALVVVAVTVITVFTDLAIAVITGVIISALVFAWQHAKHITVSTTRRTRLEGLRPAKARCSSPRRRLSQTCFTPARTIRTKW